MRFNTHGQITSSKMPKLITALFLSGIAFMYFIFALVAFSCFYYAKSAAGGVFMMILPTVLTFWHWSTMKDMSKAYIEIEGDSIRVIDYYLGIKKEQNYSFTDITSGEIVLGYSHRVKGHRFSVMGTKYIILKRGNKALFKIIYSPEAESAFKQFLI